MTCSRDFPCGGVLIPDPRFALDAAREGLALTRATCLAGHEFIDGPRFQVKSVDPTAHRKRVCDYPRTRCSVPGCRETYIPHAKRAKRCDLCRELKRCWRCGCGNARHHPECILYVRRLGHRGRPLTLRERKAAHAIFVGPRSAVTGLEMVPRRSAR